MKRFFVVISIAFFAADCTAAIFNSSDKESAGAVPVSTQTVAASTMTVLIARLDSCAKTNARCLKAKTDLVRNGPDLLTDAITLLQSSVGLTPFIGLEILKSMGEKSVPTICDLLKNNENAHDIMNSALRSQAVAWLGSLAPRAPEAVPCLERALDDNEISSYAAISLGQFGPGATGSVPALTRHCHDRPKIGHMNIFDVNYGAIKALGMIGPGARIAVPTLISLLDTAKDHYTLRESLAQIGTPEANQSAGDFFHEQFDAATQKSQSDVPLIGGLMGSNSRMTEPAAFRITTNNQWLDLWSKHAGGIQTIPQVDFHSNMVIAIFLGPSASARGLRLQNIQEKPDLLRLTYHYSNSDALHWLADSQYLILVLPKSRKRLIMEASVDSMEMLGNIQTTAEFPPLEN